MQGRIRVGVPSGDICYIGTLDTDHKVPSAENIKAVYVDLLDGRFIVTLKSNLYFIK